MGVGAMILIVVGSLLAAAVFTLFMLGITMTILKRSEVYRGALDRFAGHPDVTGYMGGPGTPGAFIKGRIKLTGKDGVAWLRIPLSGPVGSGIMGVFARRKDGVWHYQRVLFQPAGGEEIEIAIE